MSAAELSSGVHGDDPLSAAVVREALGRIVASPDFTGSDRAKRFLHYVVEETLGGRADRIKAFSVAVEVFGRDSSFDAQNDPVVRIEAGRLRRALEHYYLLSGKDDPVVIEIPKGGYIPVFGRRVPEPPASPAADPAPAPTMRSHRARWPGRMFVVAAGVAVISLAAAAFALLASSGPRDSNPSLASLLVLPFADLGEGEISALYSAGLTEEVVSELARFKELTVFGVQTSRSVDAETDIAQIGSTLGARYIVEGSVRADSGRVRVTSRLLNAETRAVLWSERYEHPLTAADLFAIQVETAEDVATAIAQPYGIVFRTEAARQLAGPPDDLNAYLCSLRYYVYRAGPSAAGHREVRECLEAAILKHPSYATARALLGLVYVDELRAGFNATPDAAERAIRTAQEAVRLDPESSRSLQSLSMALFYGGYPSEAVDVGEKAIALNPNDTELLGQLGLQLGLSGHTGRGRALLERALAKNPGHSTFYRGALAMIAYMQEDFEAALAEINMVDDLSSLPIYHGVAAIIYAQNGLDEKARATAERFSQMVPDFAPNLWAELDLRNIPVASQLLIADGLRKAGLTMPPPPPGSAAYGAQNRTARDSRT